MAAVSSAVISGCGTYRYELRRVWDPALPVAAWIMLNPSTADAELDDPTIRRCVSFTKVWDCGGITVVNLFALRATDPRELAWHSDPVGPENDTHLRLAAEESTILVCAWGAHREAGRRAGRVTKMLEVGCFDLRCLGVTKGGHPRHPLYVKGQTPLTVFGGGIA